jgi:hypothetical protein
LGVGDQLGTSQGRSQLLDPPQQPERFSVAAAQGVDQDTAQGDQGTGLEDGVAGPGRAGCGAPGHLQPSLVVAGVEPGLCALE